MAAEHVPPGTQVDITETALRGAEDKLGLTAQTFADVLKYARRVNRYRDGLRLWRIDGGGWACVHEVAALDGTARLSGATVVDVLTDVELNERQQLWAPRVDVPRGGRRPPSGPRARAR